MQFTSVVKTQDKELFEKEMDFWGIPLDGISVPQPTPRVLNSHEHIPLDVQRRAMENFKSVDSNDNGLVSRSEITTMLKGLSSSTNVEEDLSMWLKNGDINMD